MDSEEADGEEKEVVDQTSTSDAGKCPVEPTSPAPGSPRMCRKNEDVDDTTRIPKSPRKLDKILTIHEGWTTDDAQPELSPSDRREGRSLPRMKASSPPLANRKAMSPPTSPQYSKGVCI